MLAVVNTSARIHFHSVMDSQLASLNVVHECVVSPSARWLCTYINFGKNKMGATSRYSSTVSKLLKAMFV